LLNGKSPHASCDSSPSFCYFFPANQKRRKPIRRYRALRSSPLARKIRRLCLLDFHPDGQRSYFVGSTMFSVGVPAVRTCSHRSLAGGSVLLRAMSAYGTKRTFQTPRRSPLSGVKRTCGFALQMSANDPKRTCPNATCKCPFGIDVIAYNSDHRLPKRLLTFIAASLHQFSCHPYRLASGMTCRSGAGPTEISPVNGRS